MSQRRSGYKRVGRDRYETPAWATEALIPHLLRRVKRIWECAAGNGKMVIALRSAGYTVISTDIMSGTDFLKTKKLPAHTQAIITNPPYKLATEFIEHALAISAPNTVIAMLLRCDFDHAKTRQHLFGECRRFSKKIVLTKRITWFAAKRGQKKASPSFNHAWFCWGTGEHPPVIKYT